MKKVIAILLIVFLVVLSGCSTKIEDLQENDKNTEKQNSEEQNPNEANKDNNSEEDEVSEEIDLIMDQVEKMTLDEKIGQMLIIGFDGYSIDENMKNIINVNKIGGAILYSKNIKSPTQLLGVINELKTINSSNDVPLFISVDEEGGKVSRMPEELHKLPSNEWIGKQNDKELAYNIGQVIGEELKAFGFNMDFAPVLDINSNPKNPVIGDRSFGAEAEIVTELGVQAMKGIQEKGVISVVKHFPGHGDTIVDSHIKLPTVTHNMTRLNDFELIPFKEAIQQGADAVMIAHILLPNLDIEAPSSMSSVVINDILRNELKFDGVVITDDMTMGAISSSYEIGEAAVLSIQAGSDIILIAHEYENALQVFNSIKEAVENREILIKRIDESVYRILKLKDKYKLSNNTIESIDVELLNNRIDQIISE